MTEASNYVKIASSLSAFILVVAIIGAIFSRSSIEEYGTFAWAIVVIGIFAIFGQLRADRKSEIQKKK